MVDCSFERIMEIKPHPNADKLEIAVICNYEVIVGKGEFKKDDVVFYILEDARLDEYCNLKEWESTKKSIDGMLASGSISEDVYQKRIEEIGTDYKFK